MTNTKDRDILIELRTDVRYIKKFVVENKKCIKENEDHIVELKDWQEDWDTKTKTFVGIATFVGGIIVFVGNKLWGLFIDK